MAQQQTAQQQPTIDEAHAVMGDFQYDGSHALLHAVQAAQGGQSDAHSMPPPGVPSISPGQIVFNRPAAGRREEVQRTLGAALIHKCDPAGPYLAPVIVLNQEDNNVYNLIERFVRPEFLNGAERFWKLVRGDLGLDTWRPRVQGAQLKALQGARLAETEQELVLVDQAIASIADCLKPDCPPQLVAGEARAFIRLTQVWWDNRNKRPDGNKRLSSGAAPPAKRRLADNSGSSGGGLLGGGGAPSPNRLGSGGYLDRSGYGVYDEARGGGRDQGDAGPGGAHHHHPMASPLPPRNSLAPSACLGSAVSLDVGGVRHRTTLHTLTAVQGSFFHSVVHGPDPDGALPRTPAGDFFIDRNGAVFHYVLEYLRACANSELTFPLPDNARELQALAREAQYYALPGLVDHIQTTSIMPQPGTRATYDSLYLETGFKSIEGPAIKEMEKCKVLVMNNMNHVLSLRAQDGFYVDSFSAGVKHRNDSDTGGVQHNLYYNILLKRVVPLLPRRPGPMGPPMAAVPPPPQPGGAAAATSSGAMALPHHPHMMAGGGAGGSGDMRFMG